MALIKMSKGTSAKDLDPEEIENLVRAHIAQQMDELVGTVVPETLSEIRKAAGKRSSPGGGCGPGESP